MRYSSWEREDVERDQTFPPGSWDDLRKIAIHNADDWLVVDNKSEEYRQLRLRCRDYLFGRKEAKVSTGEKASRLVRSIARDPVGMVRAASPAQVRQRLEVCAGCEWLDPKSIGCKICGCSFRQKLTRASNSCPIHEWELAAGRTLTEKQQKERDNELEKAQEKYYGSLHTDA